MIIHLKKNIRLDVTLPIGPVRCFTSSALLVELADIPETLGDGKVSSVTVTVVNADGMPATAPAAKNGDLWTVLFAGTNFPTYGFTERGIRVHATILRGDGTTYQTVLGLGNLEIVKGDANAQPGDPGKSYQIKGEDIYAKTRVIDGVQHYARQEMSYDAEMGAWGADWLGDYILVDGEFVPFQAAGGTAATALLALLLVPFSAFGITATKEYVDRRDGEIAALSTNIVTAATNAVLDAARGYTDTAISQIPPPDFSTNNRELVETIEATAPAPGDYAAVSNAAVYAATTNALQDVAIESNRVNIASNRVAISTLSDTKLDKSGGTVMGGIYFSAQGTYGYLSLAYDGENHRLIITDGWHENLAYLEVPNAYDGDRVAFTHDIDAAISTLSDSISSLSTNVDAKLDKSGNDFTVSHTADGLRIADNAGGYSIDVAPNRVRTNFPDEQPHDVVWPQLGGTLALTSDIPDVPAAIENTVTTAYVREKLGAWMEYDEATGLYYYCHEEE